MYSRLWHVILVLWPSWATAPTCVDWGWLLHSAVFLIEIHNCLSYVACMDNNITLSSNVWTNPCKCVVLHRRHWDVAFRTRPAPNRTINPLIGRPVVETDDSRLDMGVVLFRLPCPLLITCGVVRLFQRTGHSTRTFGRFTHGVLSGRPSLPWLYSTLFYAVQSSSTLFYPALCYPGLYCCIPFYCMLFSSILSL